MCSPPTEKCIVFALPLADYFFSFSYPFLVIPSYSQPLLAPPVGRFPLKTPRF